MIKKRSFNIFFLFMWACLFAAVLHSGAAECQAPSSKILIKIRSIRALGLLGEEALRGRKNIIVDTRLRDLDSELHVLPFQMYQLLEQGVFPLSMKHKEDIRLATGQTLSLRLLARTEKEITLWLRWHDKANGILLDTRFQLEFGHTVLAGTESVNKSGAVLALQALIEDADPDS